METPMQELINWARQPQDSENPISIMDKMKQLLEKEKQVIIEAYSDGIKEVCFGDADNPRGATRYYKETFNNNQN